MNPCYRKRHPIRDNEFRRKWSYTRYHCYLCGQYGDGIAVGAIMSTAHIFGGAMRSDEACNLIRLCMDCHRRDHEGWGERKLTTGMMLWLKRKHDPDEYDEQRLLELSCWAELPELEEPKP